MGTDWTSDMTREQAIDYLLDTVDWILRGDWSTQEVVDAILEDVPILLTAIGATRIGNDALSRWVTEWEPGPGCPLVWVSADFLGSTKANVSKWLNTEWITAGRETDHECEESVSTL